VTASLTNQFLLRFSFDVVSLSDFSGFF